MPSNNKIDRVTIVGAGPGGLVLARILQLKGVEVKVYERETSIDDRSQGGSLDLHTESGQYALQIAELFDKFKAICRPEGEDIRITDKTGKIYYEEVDAGQNYSRPEIDRRDLRQLLLNSLKPNTVAQGHVLRDIQSLGNGQHQLVFDNGLTETTNFLIGADGAWSRIRSLVSNVKPQYSGVTMVEVHFSDVDNRHPEIKKLVGRGTLCALSDNKGLLAQVNGHNQIRVYITMLVPENWISESKIDFDQPEQARIHLLQFFSDWDQSLLNFIHSCDNHLIPRALYTLPIDHRWETKPGVTILGDAAHLMSPFAGEGVNLAMLDATELALAIINEDDLEQSIQDYEKKMCTRAAIAAEQSVANLNMFMGPGNAGEITGEFFKRMMMTNGPSNHDDHVTPMK